MRLGQGPSAVRDSPPPMASRRNRENPTPLPTGSKVRQAISPGSEYSKIDARYARRFAFGYPDRGFPIFLDRPTIHSGIIGDALVVYGLCLHHPACRGYARRGE